MIEYLVDELFVLEEEVCLEQEHPMHPVCAQTVPFAIPADGDQFVENCHPGDTTSVKSKPKR
eukprot:10869753-Lingulodinium_polyedra.AAC.1